MSAAVRTAIASLVASVDGIGRVHAYERYAREERGMRELYALGVAVRGWFVQRLAARRRLLPSGRVLVSTTWAVTGFMSFVDAEASELELNNLVDKIIALEREDPTLGGVVRGQSADDVLGFQLTDFAQVMFAGLLCHRARLVLIAETYESAGPGELPDLPGAEQALIGLVAQRLRASVDTLDAVEGRLSFDPSDDAVASPFAIVSPLGDQARLDPTTNDLDQRVDVRIAVTIVASSAAIGADAGALAAGGLEAIAHSVRVALHGWQPPPVEVPLLYSGAAPIDAGAGRIGWRMTFQPSVYIEDEANG